jgi:hypothetical protein
MNSARLRMASEGEFEKEWNRLSRVKAFTEDLLATPLCVIVEGDGLGAQQDCPDTGLVCSAGLVPSGRPLRCEPKLRIRDGETALLRREVERLWRRA